MKYLKYLISFTTTIVRQENASDWGINTVLVNKDIKPNLSGLPQDKEAMVFFIPTVLNYNNSLSYEGATLALRILMHYIRIGRTDVDVVLMGNESESNFLLHYDYPNILKIPGIHYIRFNKNLVAEYKLPPRDPLKGADYKPYLDSLGLKLPSSFKSTHSLTNDWCLYKWNSFMGFDENEPTLDGLLYFDYLKTIEKINKVKNKTVTQHLKERIQNLSNARILLIDDKDGWHKFFKNMFADSPAVDIHCIGDCFNKLEFKEIEKQITEEVNTFNPHIIILDFRLMEDKDAEIKDNMKEISGYKVLAQVLKGTYKNPLKSFGRQVLIFTATSRIENILMLREGNADGFILKERPENYNGKEITKDVISKMVSTLETAIKRAYFLIPLNEKLDELLDVADTESDLGIAINIASQSVRQLTQNDSLQNEVVDVLKLVYLNLFFILESIKNNNTKSLYLFIDTEASRIRLDSQFYSLWDDICEIRNCIAHGDDTIEKGCLKEKTLSTDILSEWTIKLATFALEFMKLYFK